MALDRSDRPPGRAHIQLFASDESAPVRWRLLSGNNRELGRGIGEYEDSESCRLGIKHLQAVAKDLEHSVQRCSSSTWTWGLALGGVQVASSGHQYDRLIRCRQGLVHFVAQFATCEIGPVLMVTASRRWASAHGRPLAGGRVRP
jgi:hypothetical protein